MKQIETRTSAPLLRSRLALLARPHTRCLTLSLRPPTAA